MHTINTTNFNIRTDLIIEKEQFSSLEKTTIIKKNYSIIRQHTNSNDYITISFEDITDKDNYKEIENIFINELKQVIRKHKVQKEDLILIIGLGNSKSTPDSLGPKVINNVLVTSHLYKLGEVENTYQNTSAFKPDVTGTTGIETSDIVKNLITTTKAKMVIVIDALASSSIKRLNKTIQITDAGIEPGSGVGNNRQALNMSELDIPVIAIGVPTIVEASTIVSETIQYLKQQISYKLDHYNDPKEKLIKANDYSKHQESLSEDQKTQILGEIGKLDNNELKQLINEVLDPIKYNLMVTPKEIDYLIDKLSMLIGNGINKSLHDQFNPTK